MVIEYIKISHFGNQRERELEFSPGINVVYGENEAGKSTIHGFIRAMFFGVSRLRGRAAARDEYSRYEPWENPAFYEGVMEVKTAAGCFCLQRCFEKNHRALVVTDRGRGQVIGCEENCLAQILPELTPQAYDCTVGLAQGSEGEEVLAHLNLAHSMDLDAKEALEFLRAQKKAREARVRALDVQALEEKMKEISRMEETLPKREAAETGNEEAALPEKRRKRSWFFAAGVILFGLLAAFLTSRGFLLAGGISAGVALAAGLDGLLRGKQLKGEEKVERETNPAEEQALFLANYRERLEAQLKEAVQQEAALAREIESLELAAKTIQDVSKEIGETFGEQLNELASEYVSRLTRGRYDRLKVSSGGLVTVSDQGRVVEVRNVSRAAREQIFLSVRLAAAKLTFSEDVPLILDESFAYFDKNRLEDTLMCLKSMNMQVILFSCSHREIEVFRENGMEQEVRLIRL